MKQPVSLIALDMDGTLFNGQSEISKEDQDAIREASSRRIHVAISTGRPYAGLPVTLLSGLGVSYAITSNGAAVYHLPDRLCIHESAMEPALVCPIIEELQKRASIWMLLSMATASASVPVRERSTAWTCPHQSNATFTGPEPSPMISLPISASTI